MEKTFPTLSLCLNVCLVLKHIQTASPSPTAGKSIAFNGLPGVLERSRQPPYACEQKDQTVVNSTGTCVATKISFLFIWPLLQWTDFCTFTAALLGRGFQWRNTENQPRHQAATLSGTGRPLDSGRPFQLQQEDLWM